MLGNMGPRKVGYGRISTRYISSYIMTCNLFFLKNSFSSHDVETGTVLAPRTCPTVRSSPGRKHNTIFSKIMNFDNLL